MWNSKNACDECEKASRCSLGLMNNEKKQEEKYSYETNCNNEIQNNTRIGKRADKIKVKGKVDDVKEEGVVRLFLANCNGFGPHSEGKIEQLKVMSKIIKVDRLMVSSSDIRCNAKNNMKILNKFKDMNKNVMLNNYDSG